MRVWQRTCLKRLGVVCFFRAVGSDLHCWRGSKMDTTTEHSQLQPVYTARGRLYHVQRSRQVSVFTNPQY